MSGFFLILDSHEISRLVGDNQLPGSVLGDQLHGARPHRLPSPQQILSWLGCQVPLSPHELPAQLPGGSHGVLEKPQACEGPVTQDWGAL